MTTTNSIPSIIQGGMGIAVSNWELARAVSMAGQLGVVSGTAIDTVLVRRLQDGDPGGHVRRALAAFPIPGAVDDLLQCYFREDGREPGTAYDLLPMAKQKLSHRQQMAMLLGAFVEVFLAKEGHSGKVGMNLLTKVQIPNLPSLYGAMLADVDVILMGAGIPKEIPGALDKLALHQKAALKFDVEGLQAGDHQELVFEPRLLWETELQPLKRPDFLAIIASNSLATMLARKASGKVDGFIIEGPTAGGHNAPPRGAPTFNEAGEPLYGERDVVDLSKMVELGRPFWIAGGAGRAGALREAQAAGAVGIQVGTLFAYCNESGLASDLKSEVLKHAGLGEVTVTTDPRASPTGYPFKLVRWPGGPADKKRDRICDLGYLRTAYVKPNNKIGYRCASEPVDTFVKKGGELADTVGRRCLCNALAADIGMAQVREDGELEKAIVTSGDDLSIIKTFLDGKNSYTAQTVLDYLLA